MREPQNFFTTTLRDYGHARIVCVRRDNLCAGEDSVSAVITHKVRGARTPKNATDKRRCKSKKRWIAHLR